MDDEDLTQFMRDKYAGAEGYDDIECDECPEHIREMCWILGQCFKLDPVDGYDMDTVNT